MNKKLAILIGLQALVIITLFWGLVYYAQDEYEHFQEELEEEIEAPSRVTSEESINIITLSQAAQNNSGIKTALLQETDYQGGSKSFGTVVPIDSLALAKAEYRQILSELQIAKTNYQLHQTQFERLKTLNDNDKNISDAVLQEAQAALSADQTTINALQTKLDSLLTNTRLNWGEKLAHAIVEESSAAVARLFSQQNVLVQVTFPSEKPAPKSGDLVTIKSIGNQSRAIQAQYVSPAVNTAQGGQGNTFYFSAPADQLRTGMRVMIFPTQGEKTQQHGVLIPNRAVVWHDGLPWIYSKTSPEKFRRLPIDTETEIGDHWFNTQIPPKTEVVVSGAQLLLSEEFKFLIKNENED